MKDRLVLEKILLPSGSFPHVHSKQVTFPLLFWKWSHAFLLVPKSSNLFTTWRSKPKLRVKDPFICNWKSWERSANVPNSHPNVQIYTFGACLYFLNGRFFCHRRQIPVLLLEEIQLYKTSIQETCLNLSVWLWYRSVKHEFACCVQHASPFERRNPMLCPSCGQEAFPLLCNEHKSFRCWIYNCSLWRCLINITSLSGHKDTWTFSCWTFKNGCYEWSWNRKKWFDRSEMRDSQTSSLHRTDNSNTYVIALQMALMCLC